MLYAINLGMEMQQAHPALVQGVEALPLMTWIVQGMRFHFSSAHILGTFSTTVAIMKMWELHVKVSVHARELFVLGVAEVSHWGHPCPLAMMHVCFLHMHFFMSPISLITSSSSEDWLGHAYKKEK